MKKKENNLENARKGLNIFISNLTKSIISFNFYKRLGNR